MDTNYGTCDSVTSSRQARGGRENGNLEELFDDTSKRKYRRLSNPCTRNLQTPVLENDKSSWTSPRFRSAQVDDFSNLTGSPREKMKVLTLDSFPDKLLDERSGKLDSRIVEQKRSAEFAGNRNFESELGFVKQKQAYEDEVSSTSFNSSPNIHHKKDYEAKTDMNENKDKPSLQPLRSESLSSSATKENILELFSPNPASSNVLEFERKSLPFAATRLDEVCIQESLATFLSKVNDIREASRKFQDEIGHLHPILQSTFGEVSAKQNQLIQLVRDSKLKETNYKAEKEESNANVFRLQNELADMEKRLEVSLENAARLEKDAMRLKSSEIEFTKELKVVRSDYDLASRELSGLKHEIDSLKTQIESKNREIDDLTRICEGKEKFNAALNEKFSEIVKETQELHIEMAAFEKEHKAMKSEIEDKDQTINDFVKHQGVLENKILVCEEAANQSESCSKTSAAENERLCNELLEANKRIDHFISQAEERETMLNEKNQVLSRLHAQVGSQNLKIAELTAERIELSTGHENLEADLVQQIEHLKMQIKAAQNENDQRIQEIARQLYHQYSKKHEVKVAQLRKSYDAKVEEVVLEARESQKKLESLECQLRMEVKEKEYLLKAYENGKENATGAGTQKDKKI